MKLSEAIRAGAKIRPQGYGLLYQERHRFSWRCFLGMCKPQLTSCALGAAYEAGECKSALGVARETFTGRSGVEIPAGTQVNFLEPQEDWRGVLYAVAECPQCEKSDAGHRVIAHLNDDHKWKREEIAVWVGRMEERLAVLQSQRATVTVTAPTEEDWPNEINA